MAGVIPSKGARVLECDLGIINPNRGAGDVVIAIWLGVGKPYFIPDARVRRDRAVSVSK